jgi:Ca2+-binding EF-hand superfamily protein
MTKKVLLIAGVVLAAGSVAAISSPYFRGGQLRLGELFAEFGDDDSGSRPGRTGKRHRGMEADDEGQIGKEDFARSRRARAARRDLADDAEDMPPRARERIARRSADRTRDRQAGRDEFGDEAGKGGAREGRFTRERSSGGGERQFARLDRNGDGFIDAKELEMWVSERSVRASQRFLKRFDADGDGKVSRDEFRQFVKDRRDTREADGDDEITEAELAPAKPGRGIVK